MTSRTCKSPALNNDESNRKLSTKKKTEINLNHLKSLQETSKAKKLKSLNDNLIKNEPELPAVIKFNFNSPGSTGIATTITSKPKKSVKGLVNHDYCAYCDEGGDLLNCDRCPVSFHLLCVDPPLSLDQIPTGEFLCNRCHTRSEIHVKEASAQASTAVETNIPICNEISTIKFEINDRERPLETLIRMAKSLNPRQMQLSADLNAKCAFDLPGLNKIKWWTKDGNKIIIPSTASNTGENPTGNITNGDSVVNELSDSKNKSYSSRNHGTSSNFHQNENINILAINNSYSKNELCFTCQKNGKESRLAKCDFCSLCYHLDCLNPPLCSMPARDRLWMCPNHMENFLDSNVLENDRLTKRINLWKNYSFSKMDLNAVKIDFIKKCTDQVRDTNKLIENSQEKNSQIKNQPDPCKIPGAIKNIYFKMKNFSSTECIQEKKSPSLTPEKNKASCEHQCTNRFETRTFLDENEKESYILAVEALQLLSAPSNTQANQTDTIKTTNIINNLFESTTKSQNYPVTPPPLNKHCSEAIKPRALLQYVPPNTLFNSNATNLLNSNRDCIISELTKKLSHNLINYEKNKHMLPPAHHMTYRTLTIGTASNMDICLDTNKCDFISDKHAYIYYDEQTNHYELLNYSENGTVVDNCLYGYDLDPSDRDDDESMLSDSENINCADYMMSSKHRRHRVTGAVDCFCCRDEINSRCDGENSWEGSAILSHGSRIRLGCVEFLFIIIDYDFVSVRSLNSQISPSPRFTHFYDLKSKKNKKLRTIIDKNELKSIRKSDVYLPEVNSSDGVANSGTKSFNSLKKLKKNTSPVIKKKISTNQKETLSKKGGNTMRKYKIDKIDAFLKLMNNKNKLSLLQNYAPLSS